MAFDTSSSISLTSSSHSSTSLDAPVIAVLPPLPVYRIDLSLPPSRRHTKICQDFRSELAQFSELYRTILSLSGAATLVSGIARLLLRRVHEREETLEIKAIAKDSGLRLCEVVAYNTFLDMFSGCTSGGVRAWTPLDDESQSLGVSEGQFGQGRETMLHFRNLDWEMDILRDLLIRVEYVRGGEVIARAVTYAGYTGVLTGVREGLSMSLNYRLRIQSTSSSIMHYLHYLAVMTGSRSSTPSQLRSLLLSPGPAPSLDEVLNHFRKTKSGTCYLTFCSPEEVVVLEKDLHGISAAHPTDSDAATEKCVGTPLVGAIQRSNNFAIVTNHDISSEGWSPAKWTQIWKRKKVGDVGGADKIMGDSVERKRCFVDLFNETKKAGGMVKLGDIKSWLRTKPMRNETTHFSCIMDPSSPGGGMVWVEGCEAV